MVVLITAVLLLALVQSANAAICESLFRPSSTVVAPTFAPSHFISAPEFYRSPISPDTQKLQGQIVVTAPLMIDLLAARATTIRAFAVVDLVTLSKNQVVSLLMRDYGISARFKTPFTVGLESLELVGSSRDIYRFLNNGFAKTSVMWVGKTDSMTYVDAITPFFNGALSDADPLHYARPHFQQHGAAGDVSRSSDRDRGTSAFLEDGRGRKDHLPGRDGF